MSELIAQYLCRVQHIHLPLSALVQPRTLHLTPFGATLVNVLPPVHIAAVKAVIPGKLFLKLKLTLFKGKLLVRNILAEYLYHPVKRLCVTLSGTQEHRHNKHHFVVHIIGRNTESFKLLPVIGGSGKFKQSFHLLLHVLFAPPCFTRGFAAFLSDFSEFTRSSFGI